MPLIMVLLESLSGLESPALNYVAQRISANSDNLGVGFVMMNVGKKKKRLSFIFPLCSQDRLDDARLAAARSSPMTECLDRCVKVSCVF